ncbi:helix-turn-helix transcriptional regulator [Amycolatopsis sp. K13G38]|uniref:Helix-turn-helix transcriptional regulator n=1 Tax=Amycolatopsis acididurans TaxID=2724524 RepID=A0ABX1JB95_9PSEU|nr:TetR/AcrR family transcriptional regulator [Amycolatopsis acididurans]NKQ57072.1 helix-turn-helix transcriptional regulator [Amycolatopsis acididurans]
MEAAEATFGEQGYRGATMGAIADRAGVTRSVLTRHFPTKGELFREVITQPLLQFVQEWTARWTERSTPTDSAEAVYEFVSDLYRNSREHTGALRMLMFAGEELDEELTTRVWSTLNEGLSAVMRIAVSQIGGRGFPTEHADITVRAVLSMVLGYVTLDSALLPGCSDDHEVVLHHLAALILHGLRLEPPAGEINAERPATERGNPR